MSRKHGQRTTRVHGIKPKRGQSLMDLSMKVSAEVTRRQQMEHGARTHIPRSEFNAKEEENERRREAKERELQTVRSLSVESETEATACGISNDRLPHASLCNYYREIGYSVGPKRICLGSCVGARR